MQKLKTKLLKNQATKNPRILIIGLGRFGQLLAKILHADFEVTVWSQTPKKSLARELGVKWVDLAQGIEQANVIFYCVPIAKFEAILKSHLQWLKLGGSKLLIDIQSVKVLPKKVLANNLPQNCRALLTHPIFGPDSVKRHGLAGLKIMLEKFTATPEEYDFWRDFFINKGLRVIEISAEEHDRQAALSQGVVFFLGRVLEDFGFAKTSVDTFWAEQLQQIVYNAVANDSWELFVDLQTKNPFTKSMRARLDQSLSKVYDKLLPERVDPKQIVFGIQGGRGSFNHQAILAHIAENKIKNAKIKFLFTSQKVLRALHLGEIDFGLFAIHNSVGGIVDESIAAMAKFNFKIEKELAIPIQHCLMKRRDVPLSEVTKALTHSQVIKQCRSTLTKRFSWLEVMTGKGDLVDPAKVAANLATGKLPKNLAVIGSRVLAQEYNLEIVAENLQDDPKNLTSFLLVS